MRENAERFFLTGLDEFHAGVIFPGAERIFCFFGSVVILLIDEGAGIGDDAAEKIGTKPGHRHGGGATGTAAENRFAPGIVGEGELRIGGANFFVRENGGEDFLLYEAGEAVGHGVVFEAALAVLAVVAAVLDGDSDEGGELAIWRW